MVAHLIAGEEGCRFAVKRRAVAVIVDALRASATLSMLCHHGASQIIVTERVSDAFVASHLYPNALLYGEREGVPPHGFHHGNSPRETAEAYGRTVLFTTTTGTQRILQAYGAELILVGTTVNASAVANIARQYEWHDVVVVPAGCATGDDNTAEEDFVGATVILQRLGWSVGEGAVQFAHWQQRIAAEGVPALFAAAPHAKKLDALGLHEDVEFCAQIDITTAVPRVTGICAWGLILRGD
jgi:2-phosphosulfolactate phosphatase